MTTNFIIHEQAKTYEWAGDCFLSIKSFYHGTADYAIGARQYKVNEENFLILNECTKYRLIIDTPTPTESFCVFFSPDFVSQTLTNYCATDEELLDHSPKKQTGISMFERNYTHQGALSFILLQGRKASKLGMSSLARDEFYLDLLTALFRQNFASGCTALGLESKKKSTRLEIYQRLYHAKDFMDSNFQKDLGLYQIAAIACMSPNHFLRNFKQLFHQRPFHYLSMLKIRKAKHQILTTDKTIQTIARDVGYSSMSNFTHYFKTITGYSPSQLRKGDI
ncbi:helix-turn-helix domain-containing protein [Spongiimicrobium salis]|uniref:helix-turn-helix domain-containing protein n=1 Tax=Spongiimicrobium salis TaxID=1667022 RepID=UPI00374D4CAC